MSRCEDRRSQELHVALSLGYKGWGNKMIDGRVDANMRKVDS